ncbi:hypothetical protein AA23498_2731 [Acetobacter nitrogenifigens DSM 23921 = NBRC 105050]|uniref:Uncharacterized protein n=1 Tax=Acetobacter nitrogenifigens DSM 23921 = NBRC 105050 TaxID=1120919 RepID=A0A511XDT7_9PROT|nr:hypothetical protein AA23498_2731 [Acetobacter nitrogenifigens DSM 23921 = NBRC 105050]GEN61120.1 hypothetical protein ANI02nite_30040 [Acetobacter nitrogenifigens DSM 23921 = NBRC 105050]
MSDRPIRSHVPRWTVTVRRVYARRYQVIAKDQHGWAVTFDDCIRRNVDGEDLIVGTTTNLVPPVRSPEDIILEEETRQNAKRSQ